MIKKSNFTLMLCLGIIFISGSLLVGHLLSSGTDDVTNGDSTILGIVKNGKFQPVWPEKSMLDSVRLTKIQMQEARSPESGEIDLSKYEGKAVMVDGNGGGGGWVYDARIIDAAGPILTLLVLERFLQSPKE